MSSSIIETNPVTGSPTTSSVRSNFAAAKSEIEALQTDKADLAAPALTGPATAVDLTVSGTLNASGTLQVGGVAITATAAELSELSGISSNVQTQLNGKQPTGSYALTTTTLTAGTGLTGGGTLAANRTFTVSYGTTAGTAAQGNDSRINNGQTAYSWGDHAAAGYTTGNQTITLSGDATGSGTTSIAVAVVNDSHSHSNSTITSVDASKVSTGTFADARISQSSVTQHQSAINAGQVDGKSVSVVTQATYDGLTPDTNTIYFVTA